MATHTRRYPYETHDAGSTGETLELLGRAARPLRSDADLDPVIDRVGDARFVLLGEASHGTSEFYTWRARLTKRLVEEKGFAFVAVEGDWPDCQRVDAYARLRDGAANTAVDALHAFDRWPTWMWANREVVDFVEWLRGVNARREPGRRVGFHGLDVYSLWDSLHEVVRYLERVDPAAVVDARRAIACFEPYDGEGQLYARATVYVPTSCEDEVIATLAALRRRAEAYAARDREAFFEAEHNAIVARNAERYYRAMVRGGAESWNVRDRHMVETLDRLVEHYGPGAKAVVWEHNTHVGDARATDMARGGMVNVGQLVREARRDEGVVIVGFASHRGTVIAAEEWDAPMERMVVPAAREGSYEDLLHRATNGRDALLLSEDLGALTEPRGHRAIGVVYDPRVERFGNYVSTVLPARYDALLYVDESRALDPLHMPAPRHVPDADETYPFGV